MIDSDKILNENFRMSQFELVVACCSGLSLEQSKQLLDDLAKSGYLLVETKQLAQMSNRIKVLETQKNNVKEQSSYINYN